VDGENSRLFVTCASALEPLLMEELKELGISSVHLGHRGVFIDDWDWSTIYRLNYASRLASRVLLPLTRFRCTDRHSLYRHTSEIDWSQYLKGNWTFAIDANVHHRELRNSLFAAQVMKDAICDQMRQRTGRRPSIELNNPDVQLNLFIQQQTAIISFDTSGKPLHKRGYRQETVEAPVQETLAAAMLRLARYDKDRIYFDPCCGSGTLLIEAALIATKTPPGYLRTQWGFMRHPQYEAREWLKVRNQLDECRQPLTSHHLFGVDLSKNAVRACKINLKAAGFSQQVEIQQADFRDFTPSIAPNFVLTNPPHGRRLEEESQLRPLYRALGDFMKQKCVKPAVGYIFTGNPELAKEVGLSAKRRYILNNGGIDSRLIEYDIY
jgi:putative N6-adenine-specific DNA methylase